MATNFPTSLDTFTNPSSSSTLDSPSHAAQHANINDAVEAVQTKLGTGAGTIGEWTDFTPNVRSTSGTLGGVTVSEAKYSQVNDLVFVRLVYKITSVGTGSGGLRFDLPVATSSVSGFADYGIGVGRENQLTGYTLNVYPQTGGLTAQIATYTNANVIATNSGAGVFLVYRGV